MKKNSTERSSLLVQLIIGVSVAVLAPRFLSNRETLALGAGFLLFASNFFLLSRISQVLVQVAERGHSSPRSKVWLGVGSLLKFFGLVAALYFLIVPMQLSGFYLALGALVSLVALVIVHVAIYLRQLGREA